MLLLTELQAERRELGELRQRLEAVERMANGLPALGERRGRPRLDLAPEPQAIGSAMETPPADRFLELRLQFSAIMQA